MLYNLTNQTQLFYNVFENTFSSQISIAVSLVLLVLAVLLGYGIIWFERFGTDQKRTVMNKLISHGLWVAVIQMPFILLSDLLRYMFGPLPTQFCFFQIVFKNAVLSQSLLYLDAITVARYLLIFWTKNPGYVKDDFWTLFVSIWIYIFSFVTNFTRYTHSLKHCRLLRCNTARGSSIRLFYTGLTKVKSCKSFLFTDGPFEVEKKNTCLIKLSHFILSHFASMLYAMAKWKIHHF